nr:MAG TPA: hypothetical protein [Caudoviricetes sp.]
MVMYYFKSCVQTSYYLYKKKKKESPGLSRGSFLLCITIMPL